VRPQFLATVTIDSGIESIGEALHQWFRAKSPDVGNWHWRSGTSPHPLSCVPSFLLARAGSLPSLSKSHSGMTLIVSRRLGIMRLPGGEHAICCQRSGQVQLPPRWQQNQRDRTCSSSRRNRQRLRIVLPLPRQCLLRLVF
jgi:hypothetical protein